MQRYLFALFTFMAVACNSQTAETKKLEPTTKVEQEKPDDSHFVRFHDNGALYIDGQKENGKKVGYWSSWYKNGQLQSEVSFEKGERQGSYKAFFPNGQLRVEGTYNLGKSVKVWNFYDSTGVLLKTVDFDKNPDAKIEE